jgi:hypothetical protein
MINDSKYVDYFTLKQLTGRSRNFLNKYLFKPEVKKIQYRNRLLFNYDDVKQSPELNQFIR